MEPTASHIIHASILGDDPGLTPAAVNDMLTGALGANGYTYTYYLIPNGGYSIVTHMERFNCEKDTGAIITENRWVIEDEPLIFWDVLSEGFWKRILTAKPTGML